VACSHPPAGTPEALVNAVYPTRRRSSGGQESWLATGAATYPIDEVREALEGYWRFMASLPDNHRIRREYRPDLPEWQAALLYREDRHGRPHPYGDRLFRPPTVANPPPQPSAALRRKKRGRA